MHILHIIPGDLWAGAEAQVYYTLQEIQKNTEDRFVVVLFNEGELYDRLSALGLKIFVIDESTHSGWQISKQLRKIIIEYKPEIIHVHEYKSHILASLAKYRAGKNPRMVRTIHGLTKIPVNFKWLKSYFILQLEQFLLKRKTDCIIAVSKDIAAIFHGMYPKAKVVQINNGIVFPLSVATAPEDIRNSFGIGEKTLWIGTAARLVPVKNIGMLIEAGEILHSLNPHMDFRISIFGDGELRNELQKLILGYDLGDIVLLHGYHNNILPILNALDVFVLTSMHEGLPMSLLEAMALGTISVCTNVGGMKEVVEDNKSGFMVESGNPRELAEKLLYISRNNFDKELVRKNAMNRVREHYSINRNTESLLSLYNL